MIAMAMQTRDIAIKTTYPHCRFWMLARFIHGLLRDQIMGGDHRVDPA
jgi:hypothetical protein